MGSAHPDLLFPPLLGADDQCKECDVPRSPSSPTSVCGRPRNDVLLELTPITDAALRNKSDGRPRMSGLRRKLSNVSANTSNPNQSNNGKSVKFHSRVRFKHVKHVDDYTDREYFATWYVEEDLTDIFNHCVDTVRKMVNGYQLNEDDGYCARGLEYKTPTGAKTRKQNKSKGLRTVLDEQERQRTEGKIDHEHLALLYYQAGADSRRAYRLLAMQDQAEVRPILQSKFCPVVTRENLPKQSVESNSQERFHSSATSVVDEFQQSFHGPSRNSGDAEELTIRCCRVKFGGP